MSWPFQIRAGSQLDPGRARAEQLRQARVARLTRKLEELDAADLTAWRYGYQHRDGRSFARVRGLVDEGGNAIAYFVDESGETVFVEPGPLFPERQP